MYLKDSEKVVSISSEHLEPITPTKNNKVRRDMAVSTGLLARGCWHGADAMPTLQVKVILGEDREATGVLLSIDGEDGIVHMDLDEQFKILNLRFLGKLLEA